MKVVRNPSMQMEKFDRPVRSVNCHDNGLARQALPFLHVPFCFWSRRINLISKDTKIEFSIFLLHIKVSDHVFFFIAMELISVEFYNI